MSSRHNATPLLPQAAEHEDRVVVGDALVGVGRMSADVGDGPLDVEGTAFVVVGGRAAWVVAGTAGVVVGAAVVAGGGFLVVVGAASVVVGGFSVVVGTA